MSATFSPSPRLSVPTGRGTGFEGPLFLGIDTHALSEPAFATALEVLAANNVHVMISAGTPYTPTPAISHAILTYNLNRQSGLADGIVITPSHNPPRDGGFKYNPPHGGPAESEITGWMQREANRLLESNLDGVKRIPFSRALRASTTQPWDYVNTYVDDLASVIDMEAIRGANIGIAVDPLGGAGVHYWAPIAERYGLNLTVVNKYVDPTFQFMTADWDGNIRMDPSSPYAMQSLIGLRDQFDIAFRLRHRSRSPWHCDPERRPAAAEPLPGGLHRLSVPSPSEWPAQAGVGKTSGEQLHDRSHRETARPPPV
jgi:Phosphoglucomutase